MKYKTSNSVMSKNGVIYNVYVSAYPDEYNVDRIRIKIHRLKKNGKVSLFSCCDKEYFREEVADIPEEVSKIITDYEEGFMLEIVEEVLIEEKFEKFKKWDGIIK